MTSARTRVLAGWTAVVLAGLGAAPAQADAAYTDLGTFRTGDTVTLEYDCTQAANAAAFVFDDSMTMIDEGGVETTNTSISSPADRLFFDYGNGTFFVEIVCRDAQLQQLSSFRYTFVIDVCGVTGPTTTSPDTTVVETIVPGTTIAPPGPSRHPHGQPRQCTTISDSGGGALPGTGSTSTPIALIAGLALATGAVLMVVRRRSIA